MVFRFKNITGAIKILQTYLSTRIKGIKKYTKAII